LKFVCPPKITGAAAVGDAPHDAKPPPAPVPLAELPLADPLTARPLVDPLTAGLPLVALPLALKSSEVLLPLAPPLRLPFMAPLVSRVDLRRLRRPDGAPSYIDALMWPQVVPRTYGNL
jgi:hypothetical protein